MEIDFNVTASKGEHSLTLLIKNAKICELSYVPNRSCQPNNPIPDGHIRLSGERKQFLKLKLMS